MTAALLSLVDVEAFYGQSQALHRLSLEIHEGEAVALMGRNGMGKTTTIRSILGLVKVRSTSLRFAGEDIAGRRPFRIARLGIGIVPEGRQIFPTLTVRENLVATAANHGGLSAPWSVSRVFELFPRLAERERNLGSTLSGGEAQMLAVGRALMLNPRLLLLDEATEGLAPLVRTDIYRALASLKRDGLTILIVDRNLAELEPLVERAYVLEKGAVAWNGPLTDLMADGSRSARLLGV